MGGKYVPPHLRNKAGSSSAPASAVAPSASSSSSRRFPNARFPPASTVSSASSAASADPPTGYRQEQEQLQQQQQQQQRKQGRALSSLQRMSQNNTGTSNGTATANGTSTAGGRFQNLASQDVRTFERSNSNSNNNNSNDRHRRFEKGPSSSLSSLSAAVEAKKKTPKVLFFGDSFIRLFTLVEHADMKVKAFKGGSAVGLSRQHNENRLAVQDDVRRCQQTLQHLVFCFGSVDVHLSYFFKTVIKQESLDVVQVAKDYVAFLATLPQLISNNSNSNSKELTIHVVGIYPSPLKDENVRESLFLYGVIPEDQTHLVPDKDITMEARQSRVRLFNQTLKECCEQYNINNNNNNNNNNSITTDINWSFQYDSVYEDVLDPNTNTLKDSMRDVSQMNIHICWEPTVILWLRKWEWYQAMAPPNFDAFLQQNFEEYLQTKPWATETHVGAHGNLKQAVENDAGTKQYSNSKYKAKNAKEKSFAADFSIDNV